MIRLRLVSYSVPSLVPFPDLRGSAGCVCITLADVPDTAGTQPRNSACEQRDMAIPILGESVEFVEYRRVEAFVRVFAVHDAEMRFSMSN